MGKVDIMVMEQNSCVPLSKTLLKPTCILTRTFDFCRGDSEAELELHLNLGYNLPSSIDSNNRVWCSLCCLISSEDHLIDLQHSPLIHFQQPTSSDYVDYLTRLILLTNLTEKIQLMKLKAFGIFENFVYDDIVLHMQLVAELSFWRRYKLLEVVYIWVTQAITQLLILTSKVWDNCDFYRKPKSLEFNSFTPRPSPFSTGIIFFVRPLHLILLSPATHLLSGVLLPLVVFSPVSFTSSSLHAT
uniref:Uncharacterized protein n=1 Tax=Cucumis melo TaxID=3656 RepID=A0A9I9EID7_CUCME